MDNIAYFPQKNQAGFADSRETHLHPGHYITVEGIGDRPGEPPKFLEILNAMTWIRKHCKRRKSINFDVDSYTLKHAAEGSRYISPGAMVQAFILCGFEYQGFGAHVYFNAGYKRNSNAQHYEDMFLPLESEQ